jgi:phage replication initiation protein
MSSWSMSIGWLRFTVPSSTVEILKRVLGEGDWIRDEKGYEGYREVWICRGNDSGYGRIATGAKRAPREVHVDLSQELISHWPFEKFHQLAVWVFDQKGHFGRIDVALDDRVGVIDVDGVYEAVAKGHCVSHFRQCRIIGGLDVPTGAERGKTLALGSRQSESYLRIYDKAAEQRAKEKPVDGPWMRWEMEWKRERAQAVGLALSTLDQDSFQKYIVGVFRTAVDFRNCTRADDPKDRYYAPILDWWKTLTEGMARAKLAIVQAVKTIEQVKRWAERSLAPTLSLLCAHPEAGERWLVRTIVDGVDRWRSKHLALLQSGKTLEQAKHRLHWWNPRDGFSVAYGTGMN